MSWRVTHTHTWDGKGAGVGGVASVGAVSELELVLGGWLVWELFLSWSWCWGERSLAQVDCVVGSKVVLVHVLVM